MEETLFFTEAEKAKLLALYKKLIYSTGDSIDKITIRKIKEYLIEAVKHHSLPRNSFDMNPVIRDLETAVILSEEMNMKGAGLIGTMLNGIVKCNILSLASVRTEFGNDVTGIIKGLVKTSELYAKSAAVESENFRNLLVSFAEDMRVILIMIADRVNTMRQIKESANEEDRLKTAGEAAYLYAPLAHKLGLYKLKSELEDLSLKYTQKETYYFLKDKLNETKVSRDNYIAAFIEPVKKKLTDAGLKFEIKGRTKSIHSIWNKIQKQKTSFENIYDLFAIRIILDSETEKEKQECWQAYSIVTDMYRPNPKRLRDWLSIPKSNGYESLHITVMGPKGKWVEVQIRTRRMNEIAERGLAAHWRYKGVTDESNGLDDWLDSVREALEHAENDSMRVMDQFKMDLYEDEIFVFTPKGDLLKMAKGATVLDFAFHIHTKLGSKCIGAKVNNKIVPLKHVLTSGDQVEIMTSSTQTPKQNWLNIATTTRARTKIRQALKELNTTQYDLAKEMLERKLKNRKIEYNEAVMMRLIKREGYKHVTDFYLHIADETLDVNDILEKYIEQQKHEHRKDILPPMGADEYNMPVIPNEPDGKEDVLLIDKNLTGLDFKLAKCCNPIFGDEIFGFVTVTNGIKIHRINCSNANQMKERFGYRIVKAEWAGKSPGAQYAITLRVIGNNDIGIVTNITSVISKEAPHVSLRSINIESNDGLFCGMLTVMVDDTNKLETLIKKLTTIKGVRQVNRY
jgi:GTP pyrophosphokinase